MELFHCMDLLELFLGTPDKQALFIHYILILHSQNDGVFSHLAWNIPETFARANVVRIIRGFSRLQMVGIFSSGFIYIHLKHNFSEMNSRADRKSSLLDTIFLFEKRKNLPLFLKEEGPKSSEEIKRAFCFP